MQQPNPNRVALWTHILSRIDPVDGGEFFRIPEAKGTLLDGEDNAMVARRLSAEQWIAEIGSIINQYHEGSGHRAGIPMTRKQAIDRLVQLGLSEGDAVRYLDRKRANPAVSHR